MQQIAISIVIPTCNRKTRLINLLQNLNISIHPIREVVIVDSGEERMLPEEYEGFANLAILYVSSEKSVCVQRNMGIRMARSPWVFLCDDDIEMPANYLAVLADHIYKHPEAGAVCGIVLQQENGEWKGNYPVKSGHTLLWKYFFQSGIWGEIKCDDTNFIIKRIKQSYQKKGNHISKAGWPVNTDFSGDFYTSPVHGLGASLVKKEWLLISPYDEVLDRHGIGDNYGVIAGFPSQIVHVVNKTAVYHHREPTNRLKTSIQYYRRVLALDYFIYAKPALKYVKRRYLLWSLTGNLITFLYTRQIIMIKATLKAILKISFGANPYTLASKKGKTITEPLL